MKVLAQQEGAGWKMYQADCAEAINGIPDNSIHYSITSIPFASLYTYSPSERDLGNSHNYEQFFDHFAFVIKEWFRVTMPGRNCSIHCMNLPTTKEHHGYIGIQDFRGDVIRAFQKEGWIYHSEVVIYKSPVTAMQRTKALGLLHKQLKKDSCMSRQGVPDYLVTFRKPGDNPERVTHTNDSYPVSKWQHVADPIWEIEDGKGEVDKQIVDEGNAFFDYWMDINPSETLQRTSAREDADERHIAPLQLQVIRRGLELWTNPGDLVFSPFAGIGSEGYEAVKNGRRFIGIELKDSYYQQACKNLARAEFESKKPEQIDLFKFEKVD
ncbi:site-specific DNA-methyltransferase [Candidatus Pacearchaeota archaeon]|jgi:DNA modification methylase|nr:site-specific DNA-methyltransferase [Candidatus Pacearchaeota archaeon]